MTPKAIIVSPAQFAALQDKLMHLRIMMAPDQAIFAALHQVLGVDATEWTGDVVIHVDYTKEDK
jgi:hypothetical protein